MSNHSDFSSNLSLSYDLNRGSYDVSLSKLQPALFIICIEQSSGMSKLANNITLAHGGGSPMDSSINFAVNEDTPPNNLVKLPPYTTFDHSSILSGP